MGQMVTHAAMLENMQSTFFPSYGPEMRGGTANCTVVISDKTVSCPVIYEADAIVVMNLPSLIKFEPMLKPGGTMLLNKSLIDQKAARTDITVHEIPANELAGDLGNVRVANMIMLGAFARVTEIVSEASIVKAIDQTIGEKKAALRDLNMKAYELWRN